MGSPTRSTGCLSLMCFLFYFEVVQFHCLVLPSCVPPVSQYFLPSCGFKSWSPCCLLPGQIGRSNHCASGAQPCFFFWIHVAFFWTACLTYKFRLVSLNYVKLRLLCPGLHRLFSQPVLIPGCHLWTPFSFVFVRVGLSSQLSNNKNATSWFRHQTTTW